MSAGIPMSRRYSRGDAWRRSRGLLGRRITRCGIRGPGRNGNALVDEVSRRVTYRAEILRAVIQDVDGKRHEAYKGERRLEKDRRQVF